MMLLAMLIYAGSRVDIFKNMEPIPGSNIRSAYLLPYPYYPGYGDILIDSNPQGAYIHRQLPSSERISKCGINSYQDYWHHGRVP